MVIAVAAVRRRGTARWRLEKGKQPRKSHSLKPITIKHCAVHMASEEMMNLLKTLCMM